jgi:hypothetical protein
MESAVRIGVLVLIGLMLGCCDSLGSLFGDGARPAPTEVPAPVALAVPPPDDTFCRSYADQTARPLMTPNLYTIHSQGLIRASEFAQCMSLGASRR